MRGDWIGHSTRKAHEADDARAKQLEEAGMSGAELAPELELEDPRIIVPPLDVFQRGQYFCGPFNTTNCLYSSGFSHCHTMCNVRSLVESPRWN